MAPARVLRLIQMKDFQQIPTDRAVVGIRGHNILRDNSPCLKTGASTVLQPTHCYPNAVVSLGCCVESNVMFDNFYLRSDPQDFTWLRINDLRPQPIKYLALNWLSDGSIMPESGRKKTSYPTKALGKTLSLISPWLKPGVLRLSEIKAHQRRQTSVSAMAFQRSSLSTST